MKQRILLTYMESGFGHISSMQSIYDALIEEYSEDYDIQKFNIMREDGYKSLMRMERFLIKQVGNTNKIPGFGKFVFFIISLLGGHHLMRFFHRQLAVKSFKEGLQTLMNHQPSAIVTNHYFTNLLAVEYKRRIDPTVKIINYNPDNTLHSFWDRRDGVFVVNNHYAFERALKYKFDPERLREVTPCVRSAVEKNVLTREQLRDKFGLPQDKFTVVIADGGYMLGKGPKFARKIIKSGLPITLCVIAGKNEKRYKQFCDIAEGKGKLAVPDGMTLKVYGFLENAPELYGAADIFITKGGPNAVLDSVYMNTPVFINYCPHMIEARTARYFVDELKMGERSFSKRKTVKRIRELMSDDSALEKYRANMSEFVKKGNGAKGVAAIIDQELKKQKEETAEQSTKDAPQTEGE